MPTPAMPPERVVFEEPEELYDEAAERIASSGAAAIRSRARFLLVLTGGNTVRPIYERLAAEPFASRIDWTVTDVFWSDERGVPPDHPESNYRLAREALLDRTPIPCERIHRMPGEDPNRERAAILHEAAIRAALGLAAAEPPAFDFALLGLGADAHVASLFPGHPLIDARDRLVGAVDAASFPVPDPRLDRLTLTPPALNGAREAMFVVTGAGKAAAVRQVLEEPRDPHLYPAQIVAPAGGTVAWLLDRTAAARLQA